MNQRRGLCSYGNNCFNKNCTYSHRIKLCPNSRCKDGDCDLRHIKCKNFTDCSIKRCRLVHDPARRFCEDGKDCRVTDCIFVHPKRNIKLCVDGENCKIFDCNKGHPHARKGPCSSGDECFKSTCQFLHEVGVCKKSQCNCEMRHFKKCREYETCTDADCTYGHHASRKICKYKDNCSQFHCSKVHSKQRKGQCRNANSCYLSNCGFLHENGICKTRNCDETCGLRHVKPCKSFRDCRNASCSFGHHRSRKICEDSSDCANYSCVYAHEYTRKGPCKDGICCKRSNCKFLHPRKINNGFSRKPVRR